MTNHISQKKCFMQWIQLDKLLLLLIIAICLNTKIAQNQTPNAGILISNNVTSFPVTGFPRVLYSQFHPGIDVFRDWKINKKEVNQFWVVANAGGYYHRFIQTAVRLFGVIEYRHVLCKNFIGFAGFGAGYLHSFENTAVCKLNTDGVYEVKSKIIGRPQVIAQLNIGCSYTLKKDDPESMKIVLQMRTFLQGPFVKNYVPFAPVNTLAIGLSIPFKCKKNEK
jgi:hypothetical protein